MVDAIEILIIIYLIISIIGYECINDKYGLKARHFLVWWIVPFLDMRKPIPYSKSINDMSYKKQYKYVSHRIRRAVRNGNKYVILEINSCNQVIDLLKMLDYKVEVDWFGRVQINWE